MRTFKRFAFFLILTAMVGAGLYHYHPPFRHKAHALWAQWMGTDSLQSPADSSAATATQASPRRKASTGNTWVEDGPDWKAAEAHARRAPKEVTDSVPLLAAYLAKAGKTQTQKAAAIFRWVTLNISYDDDAYNTKIYGATDAASVLKSRKSVCEGFSHLMHELLLEAGIEAERIVGYSKGYAYQPGEALKKTNHAWNAAKIDGRWHLMDATWAEGSGSTVDGKLKSSKDFDPSWWDVHPAAFVFTHLPEAGKEDMQFLQKTVDQETFVRMPRIAPSFFNIGFDEAKCLTEMREGRLKEVAEHFSTIGAIRSTSLPLNRNIPAGEPLKLDLLARDYASMAVENNGEWVYLKKNGRRFTGEIVPEAGEVNIMGKMKENAKASYEVILIYQAVKPKGKPS